jgi:hypothetical protein
MAWTLPCLFSLCDILLMLWTNLQYSHPVWGSYWQLLLLQKARSSLKLDSFSKLTKAALFVVKAEKLPQSSFPSFIQKASLGGAFGKATAPPDKEIYLGVHCHFL